MSYLIYALFGIWVFFDAKKRGESPITSALKTAVFGPIALPFYIAKRPLLAGEVREGGTGWNVMKNFALSWTVFMVVASIVAVFSVSAKMDPNFSDATKAGYGAGMVIGLGLYAAIWFFPMVGSLLLGAFLKKSSVVEKGPESSQDTVQKKVA
jgi:hypothetical protein